MNKCPKCERLFTCITNKECSYWESGTCSCNKCNPYNKGNGDRRECCVEISGSFVFR